MFNVYVVILLVFVVNVAAIVTDADKEQILGTVPEFFIIGAAKSGTTSLHELLLRHPDICEAGRKEKHWFDEPTKHFKVSINALETYRSMFSGNKGDKTCKYYIDSTPAYIRSKCAIANMNDTFTTNQLSQKKFILVLREPTSRECSWYQHYARGCVAHLRHKISAATPNSNGMYPRSVCEGSSSKYCEKVGCDEGKGLIDKKNLVDAIYTFQEYYVKFGGQSSYYQVQLQRWLQYIRRNQILILAMEDVIFNTKPTMDAIAAFLGLSRKFGVDVKLPESNVNSMKDEIICDCTTWNELDQEFNQTRVIEETLKIINSPDRHPCEPPFAGFTMKSKCD